MMQQFDFSDLAPRETPFEYGGRAYALREASEATTYAWRNAAMKHARTNEKGEVVGSVGGAELTSQLVAGCVFERTDKGDKPVPVETVRGWPSRLVQRLYDAVLDLSDLRPLEEQEALEKQFGELVVKVGSLALTPEERQSWRQWMHDTVDDRLSTAPLNGSRGEQEKNGTTPTPATSARP